MITIMLDKFKVLPMPLAQSKSNEKLKILSVYLSTDKQSTLEEILIITLCMNNETMVAI